jgi:hypothetical protein
MPHETATPSRTEAIEARLAVAKVLHSQPIDVGSADAFTALTCPEQHYQVHVSEGGRQGALLDLYAHAPADLAWACQRIAHLERELARAQHGSCAWSCPTCEELWPHRAKTREGATGE